MAWERMSAALPGAPEAPACDRLTRSVGMTRRSSCPPATVGASFGRMGVASSALVVAFVARHMDWAVVPPASGYLAAAPVTIAPAVALAVAPAAVGVAAVAAVAAAVVVVVAVAAAVVVIAAGG